MLLRPKICLTVFSLYEIIAVTILHFQRICDSIFSVNFCNGWYRYFLLCVIVPVIIGLILMWIYEIVYRHRRRKFFRRMRNIVHDIMGGIRGKVSEHINIQDMEKIVTAAVLIGIKKYVDNHPGLRKNINDIMDVASGSVRVEEIETNVKKGRVTPSKKKNIKRKM